ncbi:hypothetical protein HMPREF1981_03549, partial [Bacteroides pyogenes F0041]
RASVSLHRKRYGLQRKVRFPPDRAEFSPSAFKPMNKPTSSPEHSTETSEQKSEKTPGNFACII